MNWFDKKIIEPMNEWADKHPWFPLEVSLISLISSIFALMVVIIF